jgi:hypothetical protein
MGQNLVPFPLMGVDGLVKIRIADVEFPGVNTDDGTWSECSVSRALVRDGRGAYHIDHGDVGDGK